MDASDELREAVAAAIELAQPYDIADERRIPRAERVPLRLRRADAVLSVPAITDAFYAADEGEVYAFALGLACSDGWSDGESAMRSYIETARVHIASAAGLAAEA